jgi:hypothetical protein
MKKMWQKINRVLNQKKEVLQLMQLFGVALILVAVFVATSWSVFVTGMFRVHDYVHGARIAEIVRGVEAGHFPVRWSDHFGFGYGMPLYIFYAPLPYYFGGFVYWLSDNLIWGVKSLFLLANFGSIIGGYFLGSRLSGSKKGALVGAIVFGFAPYRALNLFVRGAVSEAWAMMFLIWLWYGMLGLMGFAKIRTEKSKTIENNWHADWWIVLASSVGIMLSHNLTTLMAFSSLAAGILVWIFLSVPYTTLWLNPRSWKKTLLTTFTKLRTSLCKIGSALVLAGGIASFYLLPMFIEKAFIRTDIFLTGYFDYKLHFLYIRQFFDSVWGYGGSTWGPDDDMSFFLGWPFFVAIALTILFAVLLFIRWLQKKKNVVQQRKILHLIQNFQTHIKLISLFAFLTVCTLFLTLQKSSLLWDLLPLIENIQFPWRWLSVATVAITALTVLAVSAIEQLSKSTQKQAKFNTIFVAITVGVITGGAFLQTPFFTPEVWLNSPQDLYYADPARIQTHMSEVMLDYVPHTAVISQMNRANEKALPPTDSLQPLVTDHLTTDTQFVGKYETIVNDPHQKVVTIATEEVTEVVFSTADFPGWNVYVNAQKVPKEVTETGLIQITLTPGEHQVGIRFESTPVRLLADTITLFSSIVLVGIAVAQTQKRFVHV